MSREDYDSRMASLQGQTERALLRLVMVMVMVRVRIMVRPRVRVRVRVRVWVRVRVRVPVRVRVRARARDGVRTRVGSGPGLLGGVYSHTHACKAGLSGIRFNESGMDLVESERVVTQSST